jgi:hypothetical protein
VGFWRSILAGRSDPVTALAVNLPEAGPKFGVDIDSGVLYGTLTLEDHIYGTGRITRAEALRVPAVKRARDLICGEIGQLPLRMYDSSGKVVDWSLLSQPESGIARSVTWTRVVEDLLLSERSWLRVTHVGWHGKPAEVRRLTPETVTVQPDYVYYPEGSAYVWPERAGLIRIDSPNEGLLSASPAIRACVLLDRATLNHVDGTPPIDYFTPAEGADPAEDEDIVEMLDGWQAARRARTTGYVPAALKYNTAGWDPEKLQLVEAREFAITEVARLTGIDAEELSVPQTSRTYFNSQDRRRQRAESVLGPYMTAIEGRLSMDDVTPRGHRVAFDLSTYLRLDDLSAAQADEALIRSKVLLPNEARERRGLEPVEGGDQPPALPAPAPTEETADA